MWETSQEATVQVTDTKMSGTAVEYTEIGTRDIRS